MAIPAIIFPGATDVELAEFLETLDREHGIDPSVGWIEFEEAQWTDDVQDWLPNDLRSKIGLNSPRALGRRFRMFAQSIPE